MLVSLFWLLAFLVVGITLAYRRVDLQSSTIVIGVTLLAYTVFGGGGFLWTLLLWLLFAGMVFLNIEDQRREHVTRRLLAVYRRMLPQMSRTEREALEAGTVWWEGELFSGNPRWDRLMEMPPPRLTAEEQAFLDGPVTEVCRMVDDWRVTHELADLPKEVWDYLIEQRFFAMIIPKKYGGLEFSALANAMVLAKLSSRSMVLGSTVGVPNSLGPAELLLHYGTEEQKNHYLPRLAAGQEIPCFALTSVRVGSDATAITDTGVVCRGQWQGREVIGIRLNWDKRYITLAPVATVLGLAFKLYDPDHLIGDRDAYGITAALIPADTPGITIGRRHFPLNVPFQNGPTQGKDVFVPLDAIIGGPKMAGQGWKMLVELLSVGRAITLPASAMGGSRAAVYASGAYARIRRQFGLPVGKFHGVGEAIARMAGMTYIMNASTEVTAGAIDRGEKPAVPSAILKYHNTEMARQVANDAMDVHGGKGIMLGPKNYLGRGYQGVPIGITVEGANILTRCLIIFGQGAIRCHPWVLEEMQAATNPDTEQGLIDFDRALFGHIGYAISNAARSLVMALTLARFTDVPGHGPVRRYYQHINRYSASFALTADVAMLTLGGALKRKELLSARLGDVLASIYMASMVLKHYDNQGRPTADLPLVEWACRHLLYRAQEQLHGLLRNFPGRWAAVLLRILVFPRGRTYSSPSDELGQDIVELVISPSDTRNRLCTGLYADVEPGSPLGLLQQALELAYEVRDLERRVFDAIREGRLTAEEVPAQIDQAEQLGILSAEEAARVREFDSKVLDLIAVDDFAPEALGTDARAGHRPGARGATKPSALERAAARSGTSKTPSATARKAPRRKAPAKKRTDAGEAAPRQEE